MNKRRRKKLMKKMWFIIDTEMERMMPALVDLVFAKSIFHAFFISENNYPW